MKNLKKKIFYSSFYLFLNFNFTIKTEAQKPEFYSSDLTIKNFSELNAVTFVEFASFYLKNYLKSQSDYEASLNFLIACDAKKAYEYLSNEEIFLKEGIFKFKNLYTEEIFKIVFNARLAIERLANLIFDQKKFTYPYKENFENSLSKTILAILNYFNFKKNSISELIGNDNSKLIEDFLIKYSNPKNIGLGKVGFLNDLKNLTDPMKKTLFPSSDENDETRAASVSSLINRFRALNN